MYRLLIASVPFFLTLAGPALAAPPAVEAYLHSGRLAEGDQALTALLEKAPKDDEARFGLGALRFIASVEHLGQSFHRYGLLSQRGRTMPVPFLRLPVPDNAKPETVTYAAVRQVLQDFLDGLKKTESTLAAVQNEQVKLPLRLGPVQLDLNGDGKPDGALTTLLDQYMGRRSDPAKADELLIAFDRGDVAWLRGYCHLLMALAEVALAYDGQQLFDCTAHLLFPRPETPHTFLTAPGQAVFDIGGGIDVVDLIAMLHLIQLPVKEPARMTAALEHLQQMLTLSRETWRFIAAETDDDHEWIPNPKQTGVLGVPVREEMAAGWTDFLDEADALLAGKRLLPFWRGRGEQGINLRRVFTEPRTLDLVLWVQGTAATPYLEAGDVTKLETWLRLQRLFGGEFIGFALWFN